MKKWKIRECSDLDYEGMVVDICYENERLAMLSCDEGLDQVEIKIFDGIHEKPSWVFSYFDFIEILKKSLDTLKQLDNNDQKKQ